MNIDIEERVQRARDLFREGYNCSQSVLLAYCDLFELNPTLAATLSAPLGGGLSRLREVCGAVSGMAMVAGLIRPYNDPAVPGAKGETYALVQELAERFRAENGAIVCRELLGLTRPKDDPTPSERTEAYYRKRPCPELIACAARIVGEQLLTLPADALHTKTAES